MPAATADAAEIIALMTAGNPDLMGKILGKMGIPTTSDGDGWSKANQTVAALSSALDNHPAGMASAAFARHLRFQGRREKHSKDSARTLLRLLLASGLETVEAAANADPAAMPEVLSALSAQGIDMDAAERFIATLSVFFREYAVSGKVWEFNYLALANKHSTMEMAARLCGGVSSAGQGVDLVLADLPFSAFVGTTDEVDPVVLQVVKENADLLKKAKSVLFRIEWSVGNRLPSSLAGYRRFLSGTLPGFEFKTLTIEDSKFGPSDTVSAFIAGASAWTEKFRPAEVNPRDEDSHGVAAAVAESAIRGLLRAI